MTSPHSSDSTPGDDTGDVRPSLPGAQQASAARPLQQGLHVVSTPIGNLRDISLRALDTLAAAEEILAEDTRQTRKLLDAYGLKTTLTPYHDHNGAERRPELIERLKEGATLALVSDAGTPLVSDPGYKLVRDAVEAGIRVVPVPGPSAPLAALVASGLPSDRFMFIGFLPPKSAARRSALSEIASVQTTLIAFETGPRLADCLSDMAEMLGGDRDAAVARELTKLFEETRRGTLSELAVHYAEAGGPKGEIVVLVGPPTEAAATEADLDTALRAALSTMSVKAAADAVSTALNLPRRQVYQRALNLKDET